MENEKNDKKNEKKKPVVVDRPGPQAVCHRVFCPREGTQKKHFKSTFFATPRTSISPTAMLSLAQASQPCHLEQYFKQRFTSETGWHGVNQRHDVVRLVARAPVLVAQFVAVNAARNTDERVNTCALPDAPHGIEISSRTFLLTISVIDLLLSFMLEAVSSRPST